jgi:hypothetical protein
MISFNPNNSTACIITPFSEFGALGRGTVADYANQRHRSKTVANITSNNQYHLFSASC